VAIIEHEAAIIRECAARIIAGEREIDLVRDLNQRGIPSATGKDWRAGNLKKILLHKRNLGIRVHHGIEYPAIWAPILSPEDYELMQVAFKLHTRAQAHGQSKGYLLTGIVRCGWCGQSMCGSGRKINANNYQRRYGCRRFDTRGNTIGCSRIFRGAEPIDLLVTEAVLYRFDTPEVAASLAPAEDKEKVHALIEQHAKQQLHLKVSPPTTVRAS
jgi:site-specific DNA recombinase